MDWANTLSGWQWGLLALVPPAIIALYFLKLRRTPVVVPSTYLWRKSIEDLHVNSLWQRMRKNILLLLQLLVIAMVMLALLRPSWMTTRLAGERLIFLVDNSASMNTTDAAGGTRLDDAKRRVREMIDAMESSQKAMLISFSDTARVEQSLTQSRRELREALDNIQPTNRPTSLDEALRVAASMANPGSMRDQQMVEDLEATLYIFSDGKFANVGDFSVGNLKPVFIPVGDVGTANLAIAAFSTRPNEDKAGQLQAFGRVENHSGAEVTTQAELYLNGSLVDASQLTIAPGGSTGVAFDLGTLDSGILQLRLNHEDPLLLDNEAWATVNPPHRAKVLLVTADGDQLRKVLSTSRAAQIADIKIAAPDVLKSAEHQRDAASGALDLIIYDGCQPQQMPRANTLFLNALPLSGWSISETVQGPQIIDAARAHPMMQYVQLDDVDIFEATPLTLPPGGTVLIDSTAGALLAVGPREGFEDAVMGFGFVTSGPGGELLANTTWPIRQSFPVFMLNSLAYLSGSDQAAADAVVLPGQTLPLRTDTSAEKLVVRSPSGTQTEVLRGKQNTFPFTRTDELGVYEVVEEGQVRQRFSVNLSDPAESNVATRADAIRIGYVEVQGEAAWEPARREIWKLALLAALGFLLVEWYIYNRRVYL